jgi:chromate transporter
MSKPGETVLPPLDTATHGVPLRQALRVWTRIALLSFGGPAGQIAMMHRILVEEKRWISDRRFLHALNYCMLLPGPEAQQLAIYIGWLMHRTVGGLIAGVLFVLPGFLAIMALSILYAVYGNLGVVEALFFGLKAAVLAVVLQAVIRLGRRMLKNAVLIALAAGAFVGLFVLSMPFPLIILGAALVGYVAARAGSTAFESGSHPGPASQQEIRDADALLGASELAHARPPLRWSLRIAAVLLLLWLAPLALLAALLGGDSVFTNIALFFSKLAVVTFGGAYAVLAYVAQGAVETYAWLQPGEMLDGLGMAETTPGPLIMVTQFVGFMGAFRDPGLLHPLLAGALGGLLTTWVTFTPCFLWIFLGAPFAERMHGARILNAALIAITAAVVGVILNLALWFAMHVLFREVIEVTVTGITLQLPVAATVDLPSVALTVAAALAIFRWRAGVIPVLAGGAAVGVLFHLARVLAG